MNRPPEPGSVGPELGTRRRMNAADALGIAAAGAVLKWAVTAHLDWIDLHMTGTVLLVAGLVALAAATLREARGRSDEGRRPGSTGTS